MIFGVFSGMFARATPHCHDHCDGHHGHSHHHDDHHPEDPDLPDDSDSSPHVHLCCFTAPLDIPNTLTSRLPALGYFLEKVSLQGVLIPESPVFELELPPVI